MMYIVYRFCSYIASSLANLSSKYIKLIVITFYRHCYNKKKKGGGGGVSSKI